MSLQYWYMFPIAILVATVAMASGVGGATFFAPILILGLRLPADVAIGVGLITQVFGFASGLLAYARRGLIDYRLGLPLLVVTIPAALLGTLGAGYVGATALKMILSVALLAIATAFLRSLSWRSASRSKTMVQLVAAPSPMTAAAGAATAKSARQWGFARCNPHEGGLVMGAGALFLGLIATGLGELCCYYFLQRCRMPARVAVATTVFIVAFTALPASAGHFAWLTLAGSDVLTRVLDLVLFTIPGVVIGGQIGATIASRIPQRGLERGLGILFVALAVLTAVSSFRSS